MAASPSNFAHSWLYRTARRAVICAGVVLLLAQIPWAQISTRAKKLTGPRALGLIEVTPSGKMTLLPVVVMIDGEFYDASAYKAAPVPFALDTDTIYEGVKTGVSQGLFTVTGAEHGETTWRGVGTWESAAEIAANEARKKASAAKAAKPKVDTDGPPVLRRRGEESPAPAASTPAPSTPTASSGAGGPDAPPVLKRPAASPSEPAAAGSQTASPASAASSSTSPTTSNASASTPPADASPPTHTDDPNIPMLRRGKSVAAAQEQSRAANDVGGKPGSAAQAPRSGAHVVGGATASVTASGIQYFPAISDAAGPDPRPYAYSMKPEEEAKFRDKMLALAAVEVRARAKDLGLGGGAPPSQTSHAATSAHVAARKAAKPADPSFSDVQLRVFDLSSNNEPVLVLTANASLPQPKGVGAAGLQYVVTLVAREDIYGDLHKAFSNVTDTQHLDVLPRMELIDAVDADGDGRGELLFRQVSDSGKAFVLYRVIGDQLWPLFQGKIG